MCENPKCEHGWIYCGPIIGYIPCECQCATGIHQQPTPPEQPQ